MVRSLTGEGVDAQIITSNDAGPALLPVQTGDFIDYEGARVCFLPRWSPGLGPLREFQYSHEFYPWMQSHVRGFDVLHIHAIFSYFSTRAMQLARKSGMPYLVRPLGQLDPWSLQQSATKKRLYLALTEASNLRGAAAVHCTSESEAANVRMMLPKARIEVIPHGVETRMTLPDARAEIRVKLNLPADTPLILFLSRWHRKKNIDLLLDALHSLRQKPWTLVLAGATADEALRAQIHGQINSTQLQDRVLCPGDVRGDMKDLLLQGADFFVLPSASENFGIAVAEALVNGLPALVTSGVDLATAVRDLKGGMVCEPNTQALSSCLSAMLTDSELRSNEARLRLRHAAEARFSWKSNAGALKQLYSTLRT
jgi:glycosyltransferase involved in cell wall biosynthesis